MKLGWEILKTKLKVLFLKTSELSFSFIGNYIILTFLIIMKTVFEHFSKYFQIIPKLWFVKSTGIAKGITLHT